MQMRSLRTLSFTRLFPTLLSALAMVLLSASSFAAIGVRITIAPPALPVYEQPICPGDGYLWTPGYWGWGDDFNDYYWVPGTWIMAPEVGFLWTPAYWGWGGDSFVFYDGYWGPQVGFYGGINYGFGYFGNGFEGGRWDNGHFFYNRSVANINVTNIHNVYNTTVVDRTTVNRVSYNGGNGGITTRPTAEQEAAAKERHVGPVAAQTQHIQQARSNEEQRASKNAGKPPVAATAKPGEFKGNDVAKAGEAGAPANRPANATNNEARTTTPSHVRELPPATKPSAPNTGDPKMDQKYQKQQDKQYAQQDKERQKMAQQQQKEDDQMAKKNANDSQKQQVEQRHQQQTQQLQQRHEQQQQQMQQRIQPAAPRGGGGKPR